MKQILEETQEDEALQVTLHAESQEQPEISGRLEEISELAASIQGAVRRQEASIWIGIALWVALMVATSAITQNLPGASTGMPSILIYELFLGFVFPIWLSWPSRKYREAMRKLAYIDDLDAIGPLALTLSSIKDRSTAKAIRERLVVLLRRMKATDANRLDDRHLKALFRELSSFTNNPVTTGQGNKVVLMLAILDALSQIGDERAIPHVKRLANLVTLAKQRLTVKTAAKQCLEVLEVRIEANRPANTLLRPATTGDEPEDLLLRPASSSGKNEPNSLLRASGNSVELPK